MEENDPSQSRHPPGVTIEPGRAFYPAEDYHQNYMTRNPYEPYIEYIDLPKIDDLKEMFPELYRADPVLVPTPHKTE